MSDAKKTLVEEGTSFKGALTSKCPIEVRGKIEGDVTAPSLSIASTGAVHGKVKVEALRSEGEIAGELDADIVRLSGVVKDNTVIRAKSLEVRLVSDKGKMQVMFGECALEVGDQPTRETTVEKPRDVVIEKKDDARIEALTERPKTLPPPKAPPSVAPPPNGAS